VSNGVIEQKSIQDPFGSKAIVSLQVVFKQCFIPNPSLDQKGAGQSLWQDPLL